MWTKATWRWNLLRRARPRRRTSWDSSTPNICSGGSTMRIAQAGAALSSQVMVTEVSDSVLCKTWGLNVWYAENSERFRCKWFHWYWSLIVHGREPCLVQGSVSCGHANPSPWERCSCSCFETTANSWQSYIKIFPLFVLPYTSFTQNTRCCFWSEIINFYFLQLARTNVLVSQLSGVATQEHILMAQCRELQSTLASMHVST